MSVSVPSREPLFLDSAALLQPVGPRKRSRSRRRIRIAVILIASFFVFDYGLSLLLQSGWLHRSLTQRLETAFGRPVEVSNYSFSLLEGPRLEANYVTVSEDPRFGHEYFLRADQVAVSPRWSALLRGRLELGSLSILRPSLNLVRLPDGEWNLESWLPRPHSNLPVAPSGYRVSARPARIEVSSGRLDFKEGNNKLPFALVDVEGIVEQTPEGSWRLDLRAQPFRAAIALQQAGELSLTGVVGGTSSRLRPAALELDWRAASLSDVLRLFRGYDYGMRGLFSLQLKARTQGYDWNFSSSSQFRQLHRWDLPVRLDDPAANLNLQATWFPSETRLLLTQALMEMPRSRIRAAGAMTFTPASTPEQASIKDAHLQITSDSLVLSDAFSWYRAFRRNVAEQLEVQGSASLNLGLAGWPPRIENGEIASDGIAVNGGNAVQMRIEKTSIRFAPNSVVLRPVVFSTGAPNSEFRLLASFSHIPQWHSVWKFDGHTQRLRPLFAAADAFGFNLPPGWLFDGPLECNLQWTGNPWPLAHQRLGTIALNGLKIHAPFLNHDITQVKAAISLSPQGDKVQLASANAFNTDWRGSLQRSFTTGGWIFNLSANQLSASEMDLWLNPQRRENLLDRLLPFLASQPQQPPMPDWLHARGALAISQFALSSFQFRQLHADASVDGRHLKLINAQAGFYGGTLGGSMALDLSQNPSYRFVAQFHDVDLGLLAAHTFSFSDLFAGAASGDLRLDAKGLDRDALLRSLSCQGSAQIRGATYNAMDLLESIQASERRPGVTVFPRAAADFSCANGRVNFSRLQLQGPHGDFDASGYVDFQRRMGFELLPAVTAGPRIIPAASSGSPSIYRLAGSLNAPQITRANSSSPAHP